MKDLFISLGILLCFFFIITMCNYKEETKEINNTAKAQKDPQYIVFDWEKAIKIIEERKPQYAEAGIVPLGSSKYRDIVWQWSAVIILQEGKPVPRQYMVACMRPCPMDRVPHLKIGEEKIPCFKAVDLKEWQYKWNYWDRK